MFLFLMDSIIYIIFLNPIIPNTGSPKYIPTLSMMIPISMTQQNKKLLILLKDDPNPYRLSTILVC